MIGFIIFIAVLLAFFVIVVVSAVIKVKWPVDYSLIQGKETAIA